ncbi:MAG: hypothetical protein HGA51_06500 [Demequinaceae bacterium]|nr:hypothetical protein [Demequinaceae bacterium]
MSGVFDAVMRELAAGSSPRSAARTLGISVDLADAVADEATRMGLIVSGGAACGTCVPKSSPACAGCPFTDGSASISLVKSAAPPRGGPTLVPLMVRPPSR